MSRVVASDHQVFGGGNGDRARIDRERAGVDGRMARTSHGPTARNDEIAYAGFAEHHIGPATGKRRSQTSRVRRTVDPKVGTHIGRQRLVQDQVLGRICSVQQQGPTRPTRQAHRTGTQVDGDVGATDGGKASAIGRQPDLTGTRPIGRGDVSAGFQYPAGQIQIARNRQADATIRTQRPGADRGVAGIAVGGRQRQSLVAKFLYATGTTQHSAQRHGATRGIHRPRRCHIHRHIHRL